MNSGSTSNQPPDQPPAASSSLRTVEVAGDRFGQQFKSLVPLPQQLFTVGQVSPVDLFLPRLRHTEQGDELEAVCFLPAGRPLTETQSQALRQAGMDFYYAPRDHMGQVLNFMAQQVQARLADQDLPLAQKSHLVYEQASLLMEQAMGGQNLEENLERGCNYVASLHQFMGGSSEAPPSLAKMLVLDHGLMTHSVNVCLLTTGFATHLRLPQTQILELGVGALYHDLGMRSIPESVIKKPGALTDQEWDMMRQHPVVGHDLLAQQKGIPPASLRMVLEHHENLDGSGYPRGLSKQDLDLGSRLLRLVDSYDAITAVRAFKGAKHAFEAVRIMLDEMKDKVDMDLLHDFVAYLGILSPQPGRPSRYSSDNRVNALESGKKGPQPKRVTYTRAGRRIES